MIHALAPAAAGSWSVGLHLPLLYDALLYRVAIRVAHQVYFSIDISSTGGYGSVLNRNDRLYVTNYSRRPLDLAAEW